MKPMDSMDPDKPETMPSDCRPFEGINPHDGKRWTLYIRATMLTKIGRQGQLGKALELAHTVPDAVLNVRSIHRGDRDEGEPDWLCYVSVPDEVYEYQSGSKRRPWFEKVFVAKFDEYRILQWFGWISEKDYESKFDERLL
jgi:hypothetical protein